MSMIEAKNAFVPINRANYLRRRIGSALMNVLCMLAAGVGILFLTLILYTLLRKGLGSFSPHVFTEPMHSKDGGLANAIVGSLIQTGVATLIGAPLGMAAGIYLAEVGRRGRFASIVRFVNDILLSAPSVLIGLFVYEILVAGRGFSGFAGSLALALLAVPVIARTTEDVLKLVPDSYREGSIALGARESTTIGRVIVPAGFGGILTGILLAVSRISGETAPLLFTSFGNSGYARDFFHGPMSSLPLAIYAYAKDPARELNEMAWTGALIITFGVLIFNVASRISHAIVSKR